MAGRKIGLLIGNGTFKAASGFTPLRCPPQDVEGFASLLQDEVHGGFHIVKLVNCPKQEILIALQEVFNDIREEDRVVLYYSGHGLPDIRGKLYLAAADSEKRLLLSTGVAIELVVELMQESNAHSIVLILDCCYSGSIESQFATKGDVTAQVQAALLTHLVAEDTGDVRGPTATYMAREMPGKSIYALTASNAVQEAAEKEGDDYSLLTKHILSGIKQGHADLNDDGVVTMHELLTYVQREVRSERPQEPQGFILKGAGHELELARTGKAAMGVTREEVEEAILKARGEAGLRMKVIRYTLSLVSEEAVQLGGEASRLLVRQLHRLRGNSVQFADELQRLYEENEWKKREEEWRKKEVVRKAAEIEAEERLLVEAERLRVAQEAEARLKEQVQQRAQQQREREQQLKEQEEQRLEQLRADEERRRIDQERQLARAAAARQRREQLLQVLTFWKTLDCFYIFRILLWSSAAGVLLLVGYETYKMRPARSAVPAAASVSRPAPDSLLPVSGTTAVVLPAPDGKVSSSSSLARYSYAEEPGRRCAGEFVELPGKHWQDVRPCLSMTWDYDEVDRSRSFIILKVRGRDDFRRLPTLLQAGATGTANISSSRNGPWTEPWAVTLENVRSDEPKTP